MKAVSLLLCLILSACASVPNQPGISDVNQNLRASYLQTHPAWTFNGRLSYSHTGKGGSVKAQWQQNKNDTVLKLSTALNMGSVVLTVKEGVAQIKSSDGTVREGNPEQLLQELLKSPIPYSSLTKGVRADWSNAPDASISWRNGLPLQVDSDGWRWQYLEWSSIPAVLPHKIDLSQGQTRIRIIIDQWLEVAND